MEVVNTVGRRKAAVARVFVKPGKGQITINHKALADYFSLDILQFQVKQPLLATNTLENYGDIKSDFHFAKSVASFGFFIRHRNCADESFTFRTFNQA